MKIGQAAQLTGLTISNIRFYERKGLLEPERNDQSKYRNYSEQDIRRLKQIILYRKMNMPIEKILARCWMIRQFLRNLSGSSCRSC